MFGEFFSSVSDYAKTRITNPLLGTIICVWLIRNFDFVYTLLNFEDGVTLTQKVDYIHRYFNVHSWCDQLWNLAIAFIILVSTFFILWVARALTNWYTRAIDYLNEKTAIGSNVSREVYDKLESQFKTLKTDRDQLKSEANSHDEIVKEIQKNYNLKINEANLLQINLDDLKINLRDAQDSLVELKIDENNTRNLETRVKELTNLNSRHEDLVKNLQEIIKAYINKQNYIDSGEDYIYQNYLEIVNGKYDNIFTPESVYKIQSSINSEWLVELYYIGSLIVLGIEHFPGNDVLYDIIGEFKKMGILSYQSSMFTGVEMKFNELKFTDLGLKFYNIITNNPQNN